MLNPYPGVFSVQDLKFFFSYIKSFSDLKLFFISEEEFENFRSEIENFKSEMCMKKNLDRKLDLRNLLINYNLRISSKQLIFNFDISAIHKYLD